MAPVYLVAADEPLRVGESTDMIREAARAAGFEERELHVVERGFRWDALEAAADTLSLFASKRIVELRMQTPRPGDAGARVIRALAESGDQDRVLIISINARLDGSAAKSVWVKCIEKHGVLVDIWPVTRAELPQWIRERARRHELELTSAASELIADRVEGNLLAADQELAKLSLTAAGRRIDEQAALEAVASSARFDVFRLTDAVLAGDAARALRVLAGLRLEGVHPTLVLWALVRELSLLAKLKFASRSGQQLESIMRRNGVWQRRQPLVKQALGRFAWAELAELLRLAATTDRRLKGQGYGPHWEALTDLVLAAVSPARPRRTA
jgi:DNA polymerase-3 subunit delta